MSLIKKYHLIKKFKFLEYASSDSDSTYQGFHGTGSYVN